MRNFKSPSSPPHPDAGELSCPALAERFGYLKRVGKISNSGAPVYSAHFRKWLWQLQDGRCGYCGDALSPGHGGHIDHIIPRSAGGSNFPPNVMYACGSCNSGKCDRSVSVVRTMIRLRRSKYAGILNVRQLIQLEALGVCFDLPNNFEFLCETEAWAHVEIPAGELQ